LVLRGLGGNSALSALYPAYCTLLDNRREAIVALSEASSPDRIKSRIEILVIEQDDGVRDLAERSAS
jgi:hypothetical protein